MKDMPFDLGCVHFTGIGGIGMSGIAEIMHNLGYSVQGSDLKKSAITDRLEQLGIPVFLGQSADHIAKVGVLVISSAVKADNVEVTAARDRKIPVVRRAEMLAELMRLKWCIAVGGTHGKTTTTSMVARILEAGGLDPTVVNGGILNAAGTNAYLGQGRWMVVEADESDGTFVKLPATLTVITNIDPEHLDFYGDFAAVKAAFKTFAEQIPFYGAAILCVDHPDAQALFAQITDRLAIGYGFNRHADIRGVDVSFSEGTASFSVQISPRLGYGVQRIDGLKLPMPGLHNVQNALAAIAVGIQLGIQPNVLSKAFDSFQGVRRRFSKIGAGAGRTVIDDYGHHPVEIKAVLSAARQAYDGQIIAVVQPHRYSRLKSLFEDFCTSFNDADTVIVTPVFAAGEAPLEGYDANSLCQSLRAHGHGKVLSIAGEDDLAKAVHEASSPGDVVVCMGAGDITRWAARLPKRLEAL